MDFSLHPYRRIFLQNDIKYFSIILFLFDCTKWFFLFYASRCRANFTLSLLKTLFFEKRYRFFEKILFLFRCTKYSDDFCASSSFAKNGIGYPTNYPLFTSKYSTMKRKLQLISKKPFSNNKKCDIVIYYLR